MVQQGDFSIRLVRADDGDDNSKTPFTEYAYNGKTYVEVPQHNDDEDASASKHYHFIEISKPGVQIFSDTLLVQFVINDKPMEKLLRYKAVMKYPKLYKGILQSPDDTVNEQVPLSFEIPQTAQTNDDDDDAGKSPLLGKVEVKVFQEYDRHIVNPDTKNPYKLGELVSVITLYYGTSDTLTKLGIFVPLATTTTRPDGDTSNQIPGSNKPKTPLHSQYQAATANRTSYDNVHNDDDDDSSLETEASDAGDSAVLVSAPDASDDEIMSLDLESLVFVAATTTNDADDSKSVGSIVLV